MSPDELADIEAAVARAIDRARRGALSPDEAADWLGVSPATVRRLLASGRLPFVEVGTGERPLRRIALSALERFVDPGLVEVAS